MRWFLLSFSTLIACRASSPEAETETEPLDPLETSEDAMSPVDRLVRASVTLRGLRPDPEDVLAVTNDPSQLAGIVAGYVEEPAFGRVLRDMHHEQLLMRSEDVSLPALGPLERTLDNALNEAIVEEPLALVEHIVMADEPYTAVVTADYTVANAVSAALWGHEYDPEGAEWQRANFVDRRPGAGILSTSGLWLRHPSNGRNYHRERAALLAKFATCRDFLDSDIPVDSSVDLSDDAVVADALNNNPSCVACHADLDPLAATLWGFRELSPARAIATSYQAECEDNPRTGTNDCYPVSMWDPRRAELWRRLGLRGPGFFGTEVDDLDALGDAIASDDRFAECTVRRFLGWFSQVDPADIEQDVAEAYAERFVDNGFDAKQLAVDLVMSARFGTLESEDPDAIGLLMLRPETAATMLEGLTGFRWTSQQARNLGPQELPRTDRFGYRSMAGGIDGVVVTAPTHAMTPVRALMHSSLATEAAAWVVRDDLGGSAPRLLRSIGASTDEAAVREQLVSLFLDVLSLPVTEDSPEVDAAYTLFASSMSEGPEHAWTITLSALFQDPRILLY